MVLAMGRRLPVAAVVTVTCLVLTLAVGWSGGGRRIASAFSPDRTYRVDWVTPDRLDRLLHESMSTPERIELHDNITGRLVGTSGVVDVDAGGNGQPVWLMKDMGMVSVGPGAQFLHVPPLAPDGGKLPIDEDYGEASSQRTSRCSCRLKRLTSRLAQPPFRSRTGAMKP